MIPVLSECTQNAAGKYWDQYILLDSAFSVHSIYPFFYLECANCMNCVFVLNIKYVNNLCKLYCVLSSYFYTKLTQLNWLCKVHVLLLKVDHHRVVHLSSLFMKWTTQLYSVHNFTKWLELPETKHASGFSIVILSAESHFNLFKAFSGAPLLSPMNESSR